MKNFYDASEFPIFSELINHWKIIKNEFLELDAPLMDIHRLGKDHVDLLSELDTYMANGNHYGWVKGWGRDGKENLNWISYGLMVADEIIPCVSEKLSQTVEMLRKLHGVKVCAFSTLKAGASLPCHTHPEIEEENLLQMHLPLLTASARNYSYLNVAGNFRQFMEGEPIIFDGSLDHFSLNESEVDRTILYMEFSRKLRTA